MKRYIILAGLFGSVLAAGKVSAQDTIKTTTTTTTTTIDTSSLTAPVPPPAPVAPAPAPAPVAPAPAEDDIHNADNVPGGYIGFRYMPTFTSFDVRTRSNGEAVTTFSLGHGAGGYLGANFNKHTALQLEVIYSQLSQKYSDQDRNTTVDLNYVNIPLMFVLNTNITKPVNFNVTAGPQVGINVGSKIETDNNGAADSTTAVLAVKGHDFGIAYGAGFDFRLGSDVQLGLGFRGVHGLLDISDRSQTKSTDEYLILDKSYLDTYAAYIGIRFNF
jgi:hypothetical protein